MRIFLLLLAIILLLAAAILCIKRRLFGVIVSIVGAVGLGISCFARAAYGSLAENPGIIWQDPNGIPYSNMYNAQVRTTTPYIIGFAVLIVVGILWSFVRHIRRRR